jgi:hypothetical protein
MRFYRTLDAHTLSIRQVVPAELAAARVWIENWQRYFAHFSEEQLCGAPSLDAVRRSERLSQHSRLSA